MRVFAIHDAAGTILSIVTAPDDSPTVALRTDAGQTMTEIQVPLELLAGKDDEANVGILVERLQNYRVVIEEKRATLTPS